MSVRDSLRHVLRLTAPTVILFFVASEGLLRILGYTPYFLDARAFIPSPSAEILYELRPGFRGLYAGVPISINSQGFRGRELSVEDDASALRIVVVGDSIAFGQGVSEQETLSEQLGDRLRRKLSVPVEAVNLGVPGYDTCQEHLRFERYGLPLRPRAVLLVYYENDTDPPVFQVSEGTVISPDVRTGFLHDLAAIARRHSAAYNFVWTRWQVLRRPALSVDAYQKLLAEKFDEDNPRWQRSKTCLADLVSLAREHSMKIVVIPFPVLSGLQEEPYPLGAYIRTVCDAARETGAECLDIVHLLRQPGMPLSISNVETHPSAEVYIAIAEELVKMLP
jgi:hypothetical protein